MFSSFFNENYTRICFLTLVKLSWDRSVPRDADYNRTCVNECLGISKLDYVLSNKCPAKNAGENKVRKIAPA